MFSGCVAGLIFVENNNSIIIEKITDCAGKIFVTMSWLFVLCWYHTLKNAPQAKFFNSIFTQTYLKFGQVGNFWAQKSDKSDRSGKVGQIFKKSEKLAKSDNYETCTSIECCIKSIKNTNFSWSYVGYWRCRVM